MSDISKRWQTEDLRWPQRGVTHSMYVTVCVGLIFAQFPGSPAPSTGPSATSLSSLDDSSSPRLPEIAPPTGYMELGDGQVMEVLTKHLQKFQSCWGSGPEGEEEGVSGGGDVSGITLYRDAIEHCARLYRVMVCVVSPAIHVHVVVSYAAAAAVSAWSQCTTAGY